MPPPSPVVPVAPQAAPLGSPHHLSQVGGAQPRSRAQGAPPPVSETSLRPQEVFRRHRGLQLLALVEGVLPRHGHGRHGAWHISLSKPSEKEQHLLMALVGEQGERGEAQGSAGSTEWVVERGGGRTRSGGPQACVLRGVRGCGGPRAPPGAHRWKPAPGGGAGVCCACPDWPLLHVLPDSCGEYGSQTRVRAGQPGTERACVLGHVFTLDLRSIDPGPVIQTRGAPHISLCGRESNSTFPAEVGGIGS